MEKHYHILQELRDLGSSLPKISHPYTVPEGYFENLDLEWVWASEESPAEEIKSLSPLLAGLKKENPFSLPEGYFEQKPVAVPEEQPAKLAPVRSISTRSWLKYAAAAVVVGIVALSVVLFSNRSGIDPNEKSYAWVEKNLKKVDTEALEEFVELAPGDVNGNLTVSTEVNSLLASMSENELQEFLQITGGLDNDFDDELYLN